MKNYILITLVFVCSILRGQNPFSIVTDANNTQGHITTLDHPQLNNNPNAIIFTMPIYNVNGAAQVGIDFSQNTGVWYNGSNWTIFNQGRQTMPLGVRFNVLIAPIGNADVFTHICTAVNTGGSGGTFANGTIIDNLSTNNNPNAILLVTQNYKGKYNDNAFTVSYGGNKWGISNAITSTTELGTNPLINMPVGAAFNIMVINKNQVPGFGNTAIAFLHTATFQNISSNITFLSHPFLNNKPEAFVFATNNWGWGSSTISGQTAGPHNKNPISAWYSANNGNLWSIYNCTKGAVMPVGAKFNVVAVNAPPTPANTLTGFVDMHTHPMSHLGFGGKLIHGAPDVGILVPAIPSGNGCRHYERAANINEALSSCRSTHGGYGLWSNECGDDLRKAILRGTESNLHARTGHHEEGAQGFPNFVGWPAQNDITHQQMWIDWVKRTYQNGLRVMVALTVNNATLAAAMSGPGDRNPDDMSSSNIQIDEMKRMVARHNGSAGSVDNWMEIAYSASDIRRIVNSNRLAVILGMEVDNIGNFNKNNAVDANNLTATTTQTVRTEIQRVYNQGVRYIFPVHLVDNKFGGTAIYEDMFNLSNYHQTGRHWDIGCASPTDGITKKFVVAGFDAPLALAKAKIGVDIFRNPPTPPNCSGHVNNLGLTPLGEFAIKEMMKLGMILDIDHMSKKSMDKAFQIAQSVTGGGYPFNAGHNGIRGNSGSERSLNITQAQAIMNLGGMIGVGCSKARADEFTQNFTSILNTLGAGNARLAIGTDINGFEQAPPPRPGSAVQYNASFPMCQTGGRSWDYNREGVAHYGLLPDFLRDANSIGNLRIFDNHLMKSAEYFALMWEKCERQKTNVR